MTFKNPHARRIKQLLHRLSYDAEKPMQQIQDNQSHINDSISQLIYNLTSLQKDIEKISADLLDKTNECRETMNKISKIESLFSYVSLDKLALGVVNRIHTKPRILLCGFYGANNLGDELMLESILEIIRQDEYEITIMVSDNEYLDVAKYAGLQIICAPKMINDYFILSNFYDLMIVGGGAMIDDDNYGAKKERSSLTYSLIKLSRCFINSHKQSLWIGISAVTDINNKELARDLKEVINNSNYFSVRDKYSLLVLAELGIDTKKVKLIHDLVFYNS
jgi:hypothetical protein